MIRRIVGPDLDFWRIRFRGVGTKKHNILLAITLVLCMRLFFYASPHDLARAERTVPQKAVTPEAIDPLQKIGAGTRMDGFDGDTSSRICSENNAKQDGFLQKKYMALVVNYPIAAMVPYLDEINKDAAPFLIAIAKKESDWGNHAPQKNGRDCYNYWGYKGSYNPTVSGYSCFDSPEQAVKTVGGRLDDLIDKKINTPEKMVVWKCGPSCAGFPSQDVSGWIASVRMYWQKLI